MKHSQAGLVDRVIFLPMCHAKLIALKLTVVPYKVKLFCASCYASNNSNKAHSHTCYVYIVEFSGGNFTILADNVLRK